MEEIVHAVEGLAREISNTLKELSKCKDIDQKKKLAEIIKLLSESLSVFFEGMSIMEDYTMYDDMDDDDYSDDVVDFSSFKNKGKKNKKNDIPF